MKRLATFDDEGEILRDFACVLASTLCLCCICWNCCSLAAKFIPLRELPPSSATTPSSMVRNPSGTLSPEGILFNCSPLNEYDGTAFKRVLSILKAALCWIIVLKELIYKHQSIYTPKTISYIQLTTDQTTYPRKECYWQCWEIHKRIKFSQSLNYEIGK